MCDWLSRTLFIIIIILTLDIRIMVSEDVGREVMNTNDRFSMGLVC